MTDRTYNGWTNYETWAVKLWMDNYSYWKVTAQACRDATEANEDAASIALADKLKSEHHEAMPEVEGVFADLLTAALSEVNWYEIATSLLKDVEKAGV